MIELLNHQKEEKEPHIKKTKKKKKVCSAITVKSEAIWSRISGGRKTRERQKEKMKEQTLHVNIQMIIKIW